MMEMKYKALLDELRAMPNGTKEERAARFDWMKRQPEYGPFVMDVMNQWREGSCDKLQNKLRKTEFTTMNPDAGIASTKTGREDPVVFMESLKLAIEYYTGINAKGETYTFLQSIGTNYNQEMPKAAGINDFETLGFSTGTQKENLHKVLKLVRKVKRICEITENKKSVEEVLEACLASETTAKFTKKEILLAKRMVEGLDLVASMDYELSEDDEHGTTFGEQIEFSETGYDMLEQMSAADSFLDAAQNDFEEKWETVTASTSKKNRELIKAFLSKDILITLKLEALNEIEKKKYKDILEPKCGQWCPRKECIYTRIVDGEKTVLKRDGCYIRYGARVNAKEHGDRDVYEMLKRIGQPIYEKVLHNKYIDFAYQAEVDNLEDMYNGTLKPANATCEKDSFQFTDVVLGNVLGESRSNISKCKSVYKKQVRPELYQIFKESL